MIKKLPLLITFLLLSGCEAISPYSAETLTKWNQSSFCREFSWANSADEEAILVSDEAIYERYMNNWNAYLNRLELGYPQCAISNSSAKEEWIKAYQQKNNLTEDAIALDKRIKRRLAMESHKAKIRLKQRLKQQDEILKAKKQECRNYGFEDDTDGMGLCLIELDKLAAIAQQQADAKRQREAQNAAIAQQQADAKRQREAQALINLGAIIGGAGTPRVISNPEPIIETYADSFSSTLTVPSNQNCPLIGTPITKQEVRGRNRICYYQ